METAEFVTGTTAATASDGGSCSRWWDQRLATPRIACHDGTRCELVPLAVTSVRREPQLRAIRGFHNAMDRSITLAVLLAFGMPSLVSAAAIYRCTGPTG